MNPMAEDMAAWLTRLLDRGESVRPAAPDPAGLAAAPARAVLREAFARHSLDLAGPPLPFAEAVAASAAAVVAVACWRLVAAADEKVLLPSLESPATAADHLSGDLLLRFLPGVVRRAKARGDSELAGEAEAVLCRWPLSGALAEPEGPPAALEFFGHPGLQLLYAERLPDAPRPAWVPPPGSARGWAELVFAARGRPLPAPPEHAA